MMGFSDGCRRHVAPLWERIRTHPFVRGLADGSLAIERFQFYLRQDYVFLIDFCRVLALACAKAPHLAVMQRFAGLLHATLHTEMALHRQYAAEFGLTEADLAATRPAPTTRAYTDHLLGSAYAGTFGELVAALLPCQWSYAEIGQQLAGEQRGRHPYSRWIEMYASREFADLVAWLQGVLDEAAAEGPRERMRERFERSTQYEYRFWQMSWSLERGDAAGG